MSNEFMTEEKTIKLTPKEAYLIWSVICWWQKPFTYKLKAKLCNFIGEENRQRLDKQYENFEIAGLVNTGCFIKERHPEWIK